MRRRWRSGLPGPGVSRHARLLDRRPRERHDGEAVVIVPPLVYTTTIHQPKLFASGGLWLGLLCWSMRARLIAAFAAVYVIWGSTYLAIRFAVRDAAAAADGGCAVPDRRADRAVVGSLPGWRAWPNRVDWRVGLISGALLLLGGNGAVVWAEQRVPSGIAALLVAVVPVGWCCSTWLRPGGRRPRAAVFAGSPSVSPDSRCSWARNRCAAADSDSIGARGAGARVALVGGGSLYTKCAPKATSGTIGDGRRRCSPAACRSSSPPSSRESLARLDLAHASTRLARRASCIC